MKSRVIRSAIVSSVITAVLVTGLGLWAVPKFVNPQPVQLAQDDNSVMQPAVYNGPPAYNADQPYVRPRVYRRATSTYARSAYDDRVARDAYGEPVRHYRSKEKSALIVAGSAGTGAAIGAIAGGGKGAAIGAISGGVAGFIYDRLTANK
jgi:hypothetical protein